MKSRTLRKTTPSFAILSSQALPSTDSPRRPAVLVIDEIGYKQLNRQEAEPFIRLISERYEHGSVILTNNKYFSDWGELMHDSVIATAILDRLLHHSHVINIRGNSYRLKCRLVF